MNLPACQTYPAYPAYTRLHFSVEMTGQTDVKHIEFDRLDQFFVRITMFDAGQIGFSAGADIDFSFRFLECFRIAVANSNQIQIFLFGIAGGMEMTHPTESDQCRFEFLLFAMG